MSARLIIVNGMPGTGKSTLATKVSTDLSLPLLGKDMLKEWLFDNIQEQARGEDVSKLLGKTSARMLYVFAEDFLAAGRTVIIENAFFANFARDEISSILRQTGATSLEIYCKTELEENRRRFTQRITDGTRHAVHTDQVGDFMVNEEIIARYQPLAIGETIEVDTTEFDEDAYQQLRERLQNILQ